MLRSIFIFQIRIKFNALLCLSLLSSSHLALGNIDSACDTPDALSICNDLDDSLAVPMNGTGYNHYELSAIRYFLSMKSNLKDKTPIALESSYIVEDFKRRRQWREWVPNWWKDFRETVHPRYNQTVVRFEFFPWLLTTGFGPMTMKNTNEILRVYPTNYKDFDCRTFSQQPFVRCRVTFIFGPLDSEGGHKRSQECPIYEEFTFNSKGEISFIEAWTDSPGFLPMDSDDPWAEEESVRRLSTFVPGLGSDSGRIDRKSKVLQEAAQSYDESFEAPYWPAGSYPVGPFQSMVDDINGRWGRWNIPGANISSFWPNWFGRLLRSGVDNLKSGCRAKGLEGLFNGTKR